MTAKTTWDNARKAMIGGSVKKKPKVVPKATAIAIAGEKNIATNTGTWLAKVKDAGPMTILGITMGMTIPMPINKAAIVKWRME